MCSNHQENFFDLISECSIRTLPYNITEQSLTFYTQHILSSVAIKVTILIWDQSKGWSLTRYFYYDEHTTSVSDSEALEQIGEGIVAQIRETVTRMISDHPDELKQTLHQFHLHNKL